MNNIIKITNLIIKDDGEFLLIKEWSKKKQGYFWNIIKGTFDPGRDLNVLDALVRETKEEVNLLCDTVGLLGIFQGTENGNFLLHFNFLSKPSKSITPQLPKEFGPDEETVDYQWISKAKFDEMDLSEFMSDKVRLIVDQRYKDQMIYPLSILTT